jgi:hypothetical protein
MSINNKQRIVELNEDQTSQLRSIWLSQKHAISPDNWIYYKVKLTRPQARFTVNQLFRLVMTLGEAEFEPIPEFLLEYLDPR